MTYKRLLLLMSLTILALLLAACSGGGADGGISGDAYGDAYSAAASAGPKSFEVSVKDEFTFQPNALTVQAGEEVEVTFKNTGSVNHAFVILNEGVTPEDLVGASEDEEHELLIMEMHEIAAGESNTETFTAPEKPGDYTFICTVPGHADAGMVGTLTVTG